MITNQQYKSTPTTKFNADEGGISILEFELMYVIKRGACISYLTLTRCVWYFM